MKEVIVMQTHAYTTIIDFALWWFSCCFAPFFTLSTACRITTDTLRWDFLFVLLGPGSTYLCGLVERCTLLPRSHTPRQGEENTPVPDNQLRYKGNFNEDSRTGRQVAHTDSEHILQWAQKLHHKQCKNRVVSHRQPQPKLELFCSLLPDTLPVISTA